MSKTIKFFHAHPFLLVSPYLWPIYCSISLLTSFTTIILTKHGFKYANYSLTIAFISVNYLIKFWFLAITSMPVGISLDLRGLLAQLIKANSFIAKKSWVFILTIRNSICLNSPPKPHAFISVSLQSTLFSLFITKIFKFLFKFIRNLFFNFVKTAKFSTKGYVVTYNGITITLNPLVFRLLNFTCLCFSILFLYLYGITILNEFLENPFLWLVKAGIGLLIPVIYTRLVFKITLWLTSFVILTLEYGFKNACEAVFKQQIDNIFIYKKDILAHFLCFFLLYCINSWFLYLLLFWTCLFICYISGLALIYLIFINKSFKKKYPVLFTLLVISCLILIAFCLLMIVIFTSIIIKDIKSYLLNMNTSGNSSNKPQNPSNPTGSTGRGGGNKQPRRPEDHNLIKKNQKLESEQNEDKKRLQELRSAWDNLESERWTIFRRSGWCDLSEDKKREQKRICDEKISKQEELISGVTVRMAAREDELNKIYCERERLREESRIKWPCLKCINKEAPKKDYIGWVRQGWLCKRCGRNPYKEDHDNGKSKSQTIWMANCYEESFDSD